MTDSKRSGNSFYAASCGELNQQRLNRFVLKVTKKEKAFIRDARVAHLATADKNGRPHVIPICYGFDGKEIYSPIDEKPKRTSPQFLKRVRNIRENPHVSVVIDRYDEDWGRLAYLLITGKAKLLMRGERHRRAVNLLRRKYPQYRRMAIHERPIIQINPTQIKSWGAL
jgi:PPOX class probable F420-dependent enzyme